MINPSFLPSLLFLPSFPLVLSPILSRLFPLAFDVDDITKYYACLAICTLASNKEFAATVEKSGTLALVEPFITQHDPGEFAASDGVHQHGQSEGWLRRLLPLLDSTNKEAQSLASFHFAMEATIKSKSSKHQGMDIWDKSTIISKRIRTTVGAHAHIHIRTHIYSYAHAHIQTYRYTNTLTHAPFLTQS